MCAEATINCPCEVPNGPYIFGAAGMSCTQNFNIGFSNAAICASNYSYYWDFGDGTTTTTFINSVSHTYYTGGVYKVCVTIACENDPGINITKCNTIVVTCPCSVPPESEFVAAAVVNNEECRAGLCLWGPGGPGLPGDSPMSSSDWCYIYDFGDGYTVESDTQVCPTHVYDCGGTYTGCITIYCCDDPSEFTTVCTEIVLDCACEAATGPFVMEISPIVDCTVNVDFYGGCIDDHCFFWNGGGGNWETGGTSMSHTYESSGDYDICVSVYCCNDLVTSQTICSTVTVVCPCDVPPSSEFSVSAIVNDDECTVGLCLWGPGGPGTGLGDGDPPPSSDEWCYTYDFGDGYSVDSDYPICPVHEYECGGTYITCVTIYCCDDPAEFTTVCTDVVLDCPCSTPESPFVFGISGLECTKNFTLGFFGSSGCGFDYSFDWDFGDGTGTVTTTGSVSHTYAASGSYELCVEIFCVDDPSVSIIKCFDVEVTCPCTEDDLFFWTVMGIEETEECGVFQGYLEYPDGVDESQYCIEWHWGDGAVSSVGIGETPTHAYDCNGTYPVYAKLYCCDDVDAAFYRSFSAVVDCPCEPPSIPFDLTLTATDCTIDALVSGGDCPEQYCYEWYFYGLGYTHFSGTSSASFTYPGSGTYQVCAKVYCCDDLTSPVSVVCEDLTVVCPCTELDPAEIGLTYDYIDCNWLQFDVSLGGPGFDESQYCFDWDFGDGFGMPGGPKDPNHIYACSGMFDVCVGVYCCDDASLYTEICLLVEIQCPCLIPFIGPTGLGTPDVTSVLDSCTLTLDFITPCFEPEFCWEWTFGDGASQIGGNLASHTYSTTGTYNWCLNYYCCNDMSVSGTYCGTVSVACGPPSGAACEVYPSFYFEDPESDGIYSLINTTSISLGTAIDSASTSWIVTNIDGFLLELNEWSDLQWDTYLMELNGNSLPDGPWWITLNVQGTNGQELCESSWGPIPLPMDVASVGCNQILGSFYFHDFDTDCIMEFINTSDIPANSTNIYVVWTTIDAQGNQTQYESFDLFLDPAQLADGPFDVYLAITATSQEGADLMGDYNIMGIVPPTCSCPEDINGDGSVNTTDLLQFLGAYGSDCN
jgi:PKD repeat protein